MSSINRSIQNYNFALKAGLKNGENFTRLMDQLMSTDQTKALLSSAKQLVSYHLDTNYVTFPHQYSNADYYLIFMDRLLALHDDSKQMKLVFKNRRLHQIVNAIGPHDTFSFDLSLDQKYDNGAYYQDEIHHEGLFYFNLNRKVLRFSSHALTELLVIDFYHPVKIRQMIKTMVEFAKFLQDDYNFDVEFSVLNTQNDQFYTFKNPELPKRLIDELFIDAAENHFMLKSYHKLGAQLELSPKLTINIYPQNDGNWGLEVMDTDQKVSWIGAILKYPFLRKWYLDNLSQLLLP